MASKTTIPYSFVAHLRWGTVKVEAGQNVQAGTKLGECGNSGTSFAPNLHYHLQNSDTLITYDCEYDDTDLSKGNFPAKITSTEYASGIKVRFSQVVVNGENRELHSPERGELVSNQEAK